MNSRREFLKIGAAITAAEIGAPARGQQPAPAPSASGSTDRSYWIEVVKRLSLPVLEALSHRRLKIEMPVEAQPGVPDRAKYTHLEAFGRLLCGIAPWIALAEEESDEGRLRNRIAELAREGIDAATDPSSPDRMNFAEGRQPLVDAAFLAQALSRAPGELWRSLSSRVQANVITALKQTRAIEPPENNWELFAAMIEVFLREAGERRDEDRLFRGIRKYRDWYLGDGVYGDGPEFHWDYYNSFVIHPMLLESLEAVRGESDEWNRLWGKECARLTRWAAVQERMIAPDGSYPAIGRSTTYRCAAFHALALAALKHKLPAEVQPGQARRALSAVIRRTLEQPGTWDDRGWLRIGLSGHQPALGEAYISTGSLYLCSVALLPLGLSAADSFWSEPEAPTTWEKAWSGTNLPADHALNE